jgi:hypothetical protein
VLQFERNACKMPYWKVIMQLIMQVAALLLCMMHYAL